ncbi:MAG TPA: AAA family ATPase [Terrimesophilobacter sp.]|nr:AAA family ATPase [Terrimesophilobacter sp.]
MATILHAGYRGGTNNQPNPRLPNIQPGETIPDHLRSQHADANQISRIGVGPLNAIVELLSGRATVWREGNDIRVDYLSSGKNREVRQAHSRQGNTHRAWKNAQGRTGPYLLGLVESALLGTRPETKQIYNGLIDHINNTLKISLPVRHETDWRKINNDQSANELIIHLTDSLYYTLKGAIERNEIATDDTIPSVAGKAVAHTDLGLKHVPGATSAPTSRRTRGKRIGLEPLARLTRLSNAGGTALLTGPTGTFKTETGKQLALTTNARLVTLKGAAGIEDRDFWGSIVPTEQGPKWVDGPLTKAFRLAQKSKTVLLIDELLRFEPLYANVLVGALDTVTPTELKAMGEEPLGAGAHFCVTLPSGEIIPAPKENLTIVATTNQGDDYVQAGGYIDAALLGRFELQVDMSTADESILKRIYNEIFGDADVVTKIIEFEKWTRSNTGVNGGLLQRPTNPRVTINLLREAKRLMDEGLGRQPALNAAFEVTVMPYCAPRDSLGALAEDACAVLKDEFKNVAKA